MTDVDRDLAAAAALGGLPPDEAARLEELRKDDALAEALEEYRAAVATLESGVAREATPPGLFDGILARIESERPAGEVSVAPAERPARRRFLERRKRLVPALSVGIVTVLAIAVGVAVFSGDGRGTPAARAAVQGTPVFSGVHGEARLYDPSREDGVLALDLADVPAPAAGEHYEVWVLREGAEGAMEAVGVFTPDASDVRLELRLPGSGVYEAVDISVEPDAGPAAHSGKSLAGGLFDSVS